jgi:hypothetical protein
MTPEEEYLQSGPEDWLPSARYEEWPGCRKCRHLHGLRCAAYPRNIPLAILSGACDHMVPRPGDRGIQFEPIPAHELKPARTG